LTCGQIAEFDDVGNLLTFILRRSTIEVVSPN